MLRLGIEKNSSDNAPNYDTEVAEMLFYNFYVEDLLKLVESEEIAIQLIKDVEEYVDRA